MKETKVPVEFVMVKPVVPLYVVSKRLASLVMAEE
jgi:hypothetical protein